MRRSVRINTSSSYRRWMDGRTDGRTAKTKPNKKLEKNGYASHRFPLAIKYGTPLPYKPPQSH